MSNDNNNQNTAKQATCPADVLRMIAWYDDEALGEDERAHIETHAAECAACRNELDWISSDESASHDTDAAIELGDFELPAADAVYARIHDRIHDQIHDQIAADAATPQSATPRTRSTKPAVDRRRGAAPVDWRRLALAASVLLAVLGAFAVGRGIPKATAPVYELATAGAAVAVSAGPSLDVIFEGHATALKINDALRAIGGRIVEGPTRLGVYRVQLQPGADAVAAARMLRADGEGVASLAEISGA